MVDITARYQSNRAFPAASSRMANLHTKKTDEIFTHERRVGGKRKGATASGSVRKGRNFTRPQSGRDVTVRVAHYAHTVNIKDVNMHAILSDKIYPYEAIR